MTEKKREGFLKRLFNGGKSDCCSITIEEIKDDPTPACCETNTEASSEELKSGKPECVDPATKKPVT
jgi:hypothetical protein